MDIGPDGGLSEIANFTTSGNTVQGNIIGLDVNGNPDPNSGDGVYLASSAEPGEGATRRWTT